MNTDRGSAGNPASAEPSDAAPNEGGEETFEDRVVQSIYDMFWAPEIARRGGIDAIGGSMWAALAILPENGPVVVHLNDEVQLVARSSGAGHVSPGDSLTLDNLEFLEAIEPAGIDPDAGWALLATLPDHRVIVAFDYRRNRGRAAELLDRADEFREAGAWCLDSGHVAAAIECLHAAAELAVSSLMAVGNAGPPKKRNVHSHRMGWLNNFTRLGNAPRDFHLALRRLNDWRPVARYADAGVGKRALPEPNEVEAVQDAIVAMLMHARGSTGSIGS